MWTLCQISDFEALCQISDFEALFVSLLLEVSFLRAGQILGGEWLGYF